MLLNVEELQNSLEDPSFVVDIYNIGRGFIKNKNTNGPRIISSEKLSIWRIEDDKLLPIQAGNTFHNAESYLIQWDFTYTATIESKNETIFFNWKGSNATKGLSPLPEGFDNNTSIVERVVQWSEPPVFFHALSTPLIVLNGKHEEFRAESPHLFMVRGELSQELHLYELPFTRKNLRSRGMFLIVEPARRTIFIWKGCRVDKNVELNVKEINFGDVLKNCIELYKHFDVVEIEESNDGSLFGDDKESFYHVKEECNFSPRLFYLNFVTGEFLATEIEYSLRKTEQIAAFPFLQSHISVYDQPGLFLLDNNHEIWLIWNEMKPDNCQEFYDLGVDAATRYAKLRENTLKKHVPVKSTGIESDHPEFTNIFPYWK
ncbi:unnamed protein product [Phyllotreta striolata]|uniref:Uncharacterized protein n=1 Tax=Phyllotreta striolata TaxID=444603 RepID=A0A9N9TSM4_PHYSR|nr:unnamed protein product [Phyllotreta striolata]